MTRVLARKEESLERREVQCCHFAGQLGHISRSPASLEAVEKELKSSSRSWIRRINSGQ